MTGPEPLSELYYRQGRFNYVLNNPAKYTDPFGLWEVTATGYFTDDPEDIRRFFEFQQAHSSSGLNASMNDVETFVNWEMAGESSGGAGDIYPSSALGANVFLTPALITKQSGGKWTWDEENRRKLYASQKRFAEAGNFFYATPFSDRLIDFGFSLSSAGNMVGLIGAGLTATGYGSIVGAPMMGVGGTMGTVGGYMRGLGYGIQGRSQLANYTIGLTSITWGLSGLINRAGKMVGASDKAMLTPYVLMNVVNSLIEKGEIQMAQGSITITK